MLRKMFCYIVSTDINEFCTQNEEARVKKLIRQRKGKVEGDYFQVTGHCEYTIILQLIGNQNLIKINGGAKTTV